MQKQLIALAVAGVFAAPAFAATSNVDISGTMNFSIDRLDADSNVVGGNNQDGEWNVSSNTSNIIFKGSEDLGGGLKAIWQIQTYFTAGGTGNGDTGLGEVVKDGVGTGNTYVGLAGEFGTVVLGRHEAPAKMVGRSVDLFGDQLGDNRNLLSKPNDKTFGWDLRPNNVVAYVSPSLSGLVGTVAYVTNVAESDATQKDSITAWSGSLVYNNGPLMLGLGYQKHDVDAAKSDERVWRLAASYAIGNAKLVGLYQDSENDKDGADDADVTTWGLGVSYKMGNVTLRTQYYRASDADDEVAAQKNSTAASMWALGATYDLSKRTSVYANYAKTSNDTFVNYSAFKGGHGDQPSVSADADPSGFQLGVKHTF